MYEATLWDSIRRAPRAILWDMDGTLLDSEKLWDVALQLLSLIHI